MKKVRLKVSNIHCEDCKKTLEGALGEIRGVLSVIVDVPEKYVDATFDEADVSLEKIEDIIGNAGYKVTKKTWLQAGLGV